MLDLRQHLRQKRRRLSAPARRDAAHALFHQFLALPFLNRIQHIAVYKAFEGEIDPDFITGWCWENQKQCYLPVLSPDKNHKILKFIKYNHNNILKLNKFNILEPSLAGEAVTPHQLDMILVPLTAFDRQGHRLGMGQGFYDATLCGVTQPLLLGLAYDFQCVEVIMTHAHDITLDGILTDQEIIQCGEAKWQKM